MTSLGFKGIQLVDFPSENTPEEIIKNYTENRDYPSKNGTSRLGIHLRRELITS